MYVEYLLYNMFQQKKVWRKIGRKRKIKNDFYAQVKNGSFLSHQSFIIQTCVTPEDDK